jgi:hypothetical protein
MRIESIKKILCGWPKTLLQIKNNFASELPSLASQKLSAGELDSRGVTQGNAENHVGYTRQQGDRATTHLCKVNSGCSREESITELVYFWSIANAETNDLCAGGAGESRACFAKCGNPVLCIRDALVWTGQLYFTCL